MPRIPHSLQIKACLFGALAILICEQIAFRAFPDLAAHRDFSLNPFFNYALGGMFVAPLFRFGFSPFLKKASALSVPIFAIMLFLTGFPPPMASLSLAFACLGVATVPFLAMEALPERLSSGHKKHSESLMASVSMPVFVVSSVFFLDLSYLLNQASYDAALYRIDGSLGFQPSLAIGRVVHSLPELKSFIQLVYDALPLFLAALLGLRLRLGESSLHPLPLTVFAAVSCGFVMYFILPASGPRFLLAANFPTFAIPGQYLPAGTSPTPIPFFRSAMPSLHMAWALVLLFGSRPFPAAVRNFFLALAVLTATATLGLGEHYSVDLVASFPFALACHAVCLPRGTPWRLQSMLWGLGLTISWIAFLLASIKTNTLPGLWLVPPAAAIVGFSIFMERRLWAGSARLQESAPSPSATAARLP